MKVQRQVVAGLNYVLTFESETEVVVIKVFDQSWTQTREVTSVEVMGKKTEKK